MNVRVFLSIMLVAAMTAACGEKLTEEQLSAQARGQYEDNAIESALKSYQQLVKKFPEGKYAAEAQYNVALIYANNYKDFEKSIAAYQELIKRWPDSKFSANGQFMIGYIFANEVKDMEKAREAYQAFLDKYPNSDTSMIASAKFELDNLGKDIDEIEVLNQISGEK